MTKTSLASGPAVGAQTQAGPPTAGARTQAGPPTAGAPPARPCPPTPAGLRRRAGGHRDGGDGEPVAAARDVPKTSAVLVPRPRPEVQRLAVGLAEDAELPRTVASHGWPGVTTQSRCSVLPSMVYSPAENGTRSGAESHRRSRQVYIRYIFRLQTCWGAPARLGGRVVLVTNAQTRREGGARSGGGRRRAGGASGRWRGAHLAKGADPGMAKVNERHPRTGGTPMAIRARGSRPIDYPESDGRPLARQRSTCRSSSTCTPRYASTSRIAPRCT